MKKLVLSGMLFAMTILFRLSSALNYDIAWQVDEHRHPGIPLNIVWWWSLLIIAAILVVIAIVPRTAKLYLW
jgi:hypothetical protein